MKLLKVKDVFLPSDSLEKACKYYSGVLYILESWHHWDSEMLHGFNINVNSGCISTTNLSFRNRPPGILKLLWLNRDLASFCVMLWNKTTFPQWTCSHGNHMISVQLSRSPLPVFLGLINRVHLLPQPTSQERNSQSVCEQMQCERAFSLNVLLTVVYLSRSTTYLASFYHNH